MCVLVVTTTVLPIVSRRLTKIVCHVGRQWTYEEDSVHLIKIATQIMNLELYLPGRKIATLPVTMTMTILHPSFTISHPSPPLTLFLTIYLKP